MIIELAAHRDLVAEEPGLRKRHREVLPLQTILTPDPETLTAAGHVGPVEEVEVGLLEFRKPDQAVN